MSFLKNLGKQKAHFDYSIHVQLAKDVPMPGEGLMCQLRRKDKNIHTRVAVVADDGTVTFNERLDFTGALFANKKGVYDSKLYTMALTTPQGNDLWKADLDLAAFVQHEGQAEVGHTLTLQGKSSGKQPQLRLVIWSCHEGVPESKRTYQPGRHSVEEDKTDDSRTSFASSSLAAAAGSSGATSALPAGSSAAAASVTTARPKHAKQSDRQRKISVMFGKVVSGQVGDKGRTGNPGEDDDDDDSGSDVDIPHDDIGNEEDDDDDFGAPHIQRLSAEESEKVAAFRRDRNRFASVDATNMVKTKASSPDFEAATAAMSQFSIAEGEGEDDDDDQDGTVASAQAAYTKQTRDRGFERFFQ